MSMSLRSHLVAGVAAVATTALIASPATAQTYPSALANERAVTARVDLAASVKPIVLEPLRPEQVATARAAISRIDPESTFAAAAVAAPLNAASDWVIGAYQWLQYWANYGVELADYVLQFLPFGYFIGDQITIFYDFLITPIADSVVYGLIVPVLNDPLNLSTWADGLVNVGQTSITAALNTAIVEFNYFFGWLIPPLPPLPIPPLPFAAQTVESLETVEDISLMASSRVSEATEEKVTAEGEVEVTDAEGTESEATDLEVTDPTVATDEVVTEEPAAELTADTTTDAATEVDTTEAEPDDAAKSDKTPEPKPTKSTAGGVSAQGEVRGNVTATPARNTESGAAASGSDKPATVPTAPNTGAEQTESTSTTDNAASTKDTTKTEKTDAADN